MGFLALIACLSWLRPAEGPRQPVVVYLFMGEDCVISQNYSMLLRELHAEYAHEQLTFLGLFPQPYSSPEKMRAFKAKYELPFALQLDDGQQWMKRFNVRVTPEVVVYLPETGEVLYQGRIDNTYYSLGRRRQVTTSSELHDVLEAVRQGDYRSHPRTDAVGCFITPAGPAFEDVPMCDTTSQR